MPRQEQRWSVKVKNMERKVIKIRYAGDGFFLAGLSELRKQLGFEFSENGRLIEAVLSDSREITVRGGEEKTTFIYYDKVSFFRAFSLALQAVAENNLKTIRVKPLMKELGTMQNCSVSVLNLPTVKQLVRQHAKLLYIMVRNSRGLSSSPLYLTSM